MSDRSQNDTVHTLTFGCRLNAYETELMRERAYEAGLSQRPGGAVIVNTCAVTGEAVRQARQAIRKARRERPDARIIVSGCAAQAEPELFARMDQVDLVLGNQEKLQAASYRALPEFGVNQFEKVRVGDIMSETTIKPQSISTFQGRSRAFVQVQNGCDHRCTFCVIPFGRGNSRSVPIGDVVEQVRRLVASGHREIVLTGVDTTSWGRDLPDAPMLGGLVRAVLDSEPKLERLRLSSIDSIEVDPILVGIIETEPRFMPHLHLSLQHGDDLILKRMKRRHVRADAIAFCREIRSRRPDMTFGADLIAGFPTETEAMFQRTLDLVEECGLTQLHVFPFSPRPMTPAARMPQVERAEIVSRAARLRECGRIRFADHLAARIGGTARILVEQNNSGRSEDNTPVQITGATVEKGTIIDVRLTAHDGKRALAQPLATTDLAVAN